MGGFSPQAFSTAAFSVLAFSLGELVAAVEGSVKVLRDLRVWLVTPQARSWLTQDLPRSWSGTPDLRGWEAMGYGRLWLADVALRGWTI